jgi:hypothetical protein
LKDEKELQTGNFNKNIKNKKGTSVDGMPFLLLIIAVR